MKRLLVPLALFAILLFFIWSNRVNIVVWALPKIINITKERTIDVMITRLRQKIESNPKNPKYLQTIRGSGYVLWIK